MNLNSSNGVFRLYNAKKLGKAQKLSYFTRPLINYS